MTPLHLSQWRSKLLLRLSSWNKIEFFENTAVLLLHLNQYKMWLIQTKYNNLIVLSLFIHPIKKKEIKERGQYKTRHLVIHQNTKNAADILYY